jgi:YbgC/YbaW family acyl-CoA thioester hydrolase
MKFKDIHEHKANIKYSDLDMYSVLYHPNYLELLDTARNQAFKFYGYPIEEQFADKVGFTVAGINNVEFKRPLFMDENISIFTEVISFTKRSCEVRHWIELDSSEKEAKKVIFKAEYSLVFVSIAGVDGFPLNAHNVKGLKAIEFTDKVKTLLNIGNV